MRLEDFVEDSKMLETKELPVKVPVRRQAQGMITLSDNTATTLLIRHIGMGWIQALARELDLRSTYHRRRIMDLEFRTRGERTSRRRRTWLSCWVRSGTFPCSLQSSEP